MHGHERRHPRALPRCSRRCSSPATRSSCRTRSGRRARATSLAARGVPVPCPLHERLGWRFDLDELESKITPRTRAIYINSPHNPTGGVLTRADVEADRRDRPRARSVADLGRGVRGRRLRRREHVSPASLPGMYERTIPVYTFSKTYAMTGLRLGLSRGAGSEAARADEEGRSSTRPATSSSVVQFGGDRRARGIAGVHRRHSGRSCSARRDLFYDGLGEARRRSCSPARRRKARSTRSCASTRAGRHRAGGVRSRSRGRWPST